MKVAFLFAGQGTQSVKMGYPLYEHGYTKIMDAYPEIRDLIFNGPSEELNQTKNAQKAILLTSLSICEFLKENGVRPSFVAGLSLGEYSALTCAEVFSLDNALKIVTKRGQIMQDALPLNTSSMAAVLNLDEKVILETIKEVDGICEIANYNCPGQIVITGENKAIEEASKKLMEKGARRVVKLNVSGAFHSSLLNEASNHLRAVLDEYQFNKPVMDVVFNVYGSTSSEDIKDILQKQIKSSVRFIQSIEFMIAQGVDTFVEVGPGTTLSSFVKKINPNVKIYNTNTLENILKVVEEVR